MRSMPESKVEGQGGKMEGGMISKEVRGEKHGKRQSVDTEVSPEVGLLIN